MAFGLDEILSSDPGTYERTKTKAPGPTGQLPLDEQSLRNWSSGDLFGLTQNVGMGWSPAALRSDEFLILSTAGGLRAGRSPPVRPAVP